MNSTTVTQCGQLRPVFDVEGVSEAIHVKLGQSIFLDFQKKYTNLINESNIIE